MYHQYSPERLEKKAIEMLSAYRNGELLRKPQATNIDDFAEFHLDLSMDSAYLSKDGKTLGCTCFNTGYLKVWDETRQKESPMKLF